MKRAAFLATLALVGGLLTQPAVARSRDKERRSQEQSQEQKASKQKQSERSEREDRSERSARNVEPERERSERRSPRQVEDTRSRAARRAQEANGGGRVLNVQPDDGGYRVKLLKDGEVRTLR